MIAISAGNHAQARRLGRRARGDRLRCVVMWRGASAVKVAARAATARRSTSRRRGPGEAFERLDGAAGGDRAARSCTRSTTRVSIAGQGTVGLEILEQVPGRRHDRRAGRRRRAHRRDRDAAAGRAASIGVEPELSTALHAALKAGERVPVDADARSPTGSARRIAGSTRVATSASASEESCSSRRTRSRTAFRFLYERAKLACEPAGAAAVGGAAERASVERRTTVVAVVSGGNVAAETASAILARR